GLGVCSAHDLVVASSRLARGDASVAIGVNMHLVGVLNMERRRQVAVAAGAERRARGFAASLQQIAAGGAVLAAALSEPGEGPTRPGAGGDERPARVFAASLQQIAADGAVLAAAISEPGQDLTRPATRATRTDTGWRIDGRKMFCTMSPAATALYVA